MEDSRRKQKRRRKQKKGKMAEGAEAKEENVAVDSLAEQVTRQHIVDTKGAEAKEENVAVDSLAEQVTRQHIVDTSITSGLVIDYERKHSTIPYITYHGKLDGEEIVAQKRNDPVTIVRHPNFLSHIGLHKIGEDSFHVYEPFLCTLSDFKKQPDLYGFKDFYIDELYPSRVMLKFFKNIFTALTYLLNKKMFYKNISLQNIVIVKYDDGSDPNVCAKFIGDCAHGLPRLERDMNGVKALLEAFFDFSKQGKTEKNNEAEDLLSRFTRNQNGDNGVERFALREVFSKDFTLLLRHPLFYNDERCMEYYRKFGDFLSGSKQKQKDFKKALRRLNYNYWNSKYDPILKEQCENARTLYREKRNEEEEEKRYAGYYGSSIALVKYHRNIVSHYCEIICEAADAFNGHKFPHIRRAMRTYHPKLLIEIYTIYERHQKSSKMEDEDYLGNYYMDYVSKVAQLS